jgi:anti-sigma B factor antagonist
MVRFEVNVDEAGPGRHVVTVDGELDLATAGGLWKQLQPLIEPGVLIVLDGTEMTFLDSSGLRVLLMAGSAATACGATLRLVMPQPAVQRVLDLAGVIGHLHIRADVPAALVD